MVFGNTEKEKIQLNESSVWSGGPNRNDNPDALAALPEIRKLIFEGKFQEASKMAAEKHTVKEESWNEISAGWRSGIILPGS